MWCSYEPLATLQRIVLCTGNSARTILAESLMNPVGRGKFHGFSAFASASGGGVVCIRMKQLLAVDFVIAYGLLPLRRYQPINELLT